MHNGWIKLHRKIIDKAFYRKPTYLLLWVHILLSANHSAREFMWNGSTIIVKEGQLITGRKELSQQTGIPETTIERILNYLESEHQIEQQKTTKYRLVTVLNWKDYQHADSEVDNKRTTNGQQTDTNKNVKKDKNEKNTQPPETDGGVVNQVIELFKEVNPSYSLCFKRKQQRDAAHNLFKAHGIDRLTNILGYVKANANNRYLPTITTPCQLEEKLAALETFARRQKAEATNKRHVII